MFDFIHGKVEFIDIQYIVIEVNGIGYQIHCPNPYIFQKEINEQCKIYTYQHVREDLIRLYGFKTREERHLFEKLLNVSGIGPKGALAILASGQPEQLVNAIEEEDEKYLVKFPGVGKKTARQIILDLKGKLDEFAPNLFQQDVSKVFSKESRSSNSKELDEAVEALKALGYVDREITKIVPQLEKEQTTTDQYIKKALQLMLKQ
ncbi:Holliday junction branch migration protein RuvA [Alkalihalobacillus sp. BA299]|uniref:Holliday junction branch migration protein RuvA n=1 Tax=Alkalihalobacillus sp. BA299 TaxID=2815938 RepID=UPI001ADA47B2|nr:Holliday junction branch migration protein RuvA [Alkalihalobacillus sp. BA299]